MANPDLNTYGSGKYTGLMMKHAGALNVAAATVKGARRVSLEQILQWNPEVIFVGTAIRRWSNRLKTTRNGKR